MPYQRYDFNPTEMNAKSLDDIDIQPLYITRARYDKQWQSMLHTHSFTEFFYIIAGQGRFLIEGISWRVKSDDLIVINPNVMHTEFNDGEEDLEYIALGIDGLFFQTEDGRNSPCSLYNLKNYRTDLLFYMKTIIQELHQRNSGYQEICQHLINTFMLFILRYTKVNITAATSDRTSRECKFIEQYLDEHFSENITLETLSNLTYMNKYYIVHAFKKYKGISPISYLINRRIAEAKRLLETTNYSVSKVAQSIGFSSQSYFSQVFRKELGLTPLQYRKQFDK